MLRFGGSAGGPRKIVFLRNEPKAPAAIPSAKRRPEKTGAFKHRSGAETEKVFSEERTECPAKSSVPAIGAVVIRVKCLRLPSAVLRVPQAPLAVPANARLPASPCGAGRERVAACSRSQSRSSPPHWPESQSPCRTTPLPRRSRPGRVVATLADRQEFKKRVAGPRLRHCIIRHGDTFDQVLSAFAAKSGASPAWHPAHAFGTFNEAVVAGVMNLNV